LSHRPDYFKLVRKTIEGLLERFQEVRPDSKLVDDLDLYDIDLDEVHDVLEDQFDIIIDDEKWSTMYTNPNATVQDIVDLLETT
jgi:acyl carrier protein